MLAVIQIPIDLRKNQLSRSASLSALLFISIVVTVDAAMSGSFRNLLVSIMSATFLFGLYLMTHRRVPDALGFGDVVLVFPLGLSIAYFAIDQIGIWQLTSAITGGIHAVLARTVARRNSIPFGPHLLLSALAVLIVSV